MRDITIAERYAIALIEIGKDKGTVETLNDELGRVQRLFDSSAELRNLFSNPRFNTEVRRGVLGELLERSVVSPTCRNFLFLLVDQGRIKALKTIVASYGALVDKHLGRVRAHVTVARALSGPEKARLSRALKSALNKEILLEQSVDPSLIGGAITRVDGRVYDGSLRARLDGLGSVLRTQI